MAGGRKLGRIVVEKSARMARLNRRRIEAAGAVAVNLIGSPGSGKTTLLERSIELLQRMGAGEAPLRVAVIEGDVQTTLDRDRILRAGAAAVQIETHGACRLDAAMVRRALDDIPLGETDILFIENVGNLICPAGLEVGEHVKVAVVSVPEGDEKPAKYPELFVRADAVVVSKMDLLPHVEYELGRVVGDCRKLNARVQVFPLSAKTGEGMAGWVEYVRRLRGRKWGRGPRGEAGRG